jgi:hypothetical protein
VEYRRFLIRFTRRICRFSKSRIELEQLPRLKID